LPSNTLAIVCFKRVALEVDEPRSFVRTQSGALFCVLERITGREMPLIATQSRAGRMPILLCKWWRSATKAFCFPQAPRA